MADWFDGLLVQFTQLWNVRVVDTPFMIQVMCWVAGLGFVGCLLLSIFRRSP